MVPVAVPLDIMGLIVPDVVVSCIDDLFTDAEISNPQNGQKRTRSTSVSTLKALSAASRHLRCLTLTVTSAGLGTGLSKASTWRFFEPPWRVIQRTPRIPSKASMRAYESFAQDLLPGQSPVCIFYPLYHTATHDLRSAYNRLRPLEQGVGEDEFGERPDPGEPERHAMHARRRLHLARQMALRALPAYRAQLLKRADDLQVQVSGFLGLRLPSQRISAIMEVVRIQADGVTCLDGRCFEERRVQLEKLLLRMEDFVSSVADIERVSNLTCRSKDEFIGVETGTFAAALRALRWVSRFEKLDSSSTGAAVGLAQVAEACGRCTALARAVANILECSLPAR
ncbi:hypothetical protein PsYK624_118650 [Phanerochaete sordida]|uniref:Uncharacterized protein n=1 Tax=Phanerochaete sordida TaxID=48140 RepID=A0A9P3LIH6_9APHY|nr:hypothetical protein PsYK624_118650 [Phanerochaete sordida]